MHLAATLIPYTPRVLPPGRVSRVTVLSTLWLFNQSYSIVMIIIVVTESLLQCYANSLEQYSLEVISQR